MSYQVTITEKKGTCNTEIFDIMTKNGDITAIKIGDVVNQELTITGYAKCNIKTDTKNFNLNYFDTKELGLVSTGSEIFTKSVINYFGKVEKVRIVKIQTNKGNTFKAVPVLNSKTETKEETTDESDLPF